MSTTAGVDRPFGPPPQFPAPDDRAPASALDLAQAADYLERITKAVEKQVRHEHVPWDRAYSITIQPTSSYTLQTPNALSGFAFNNTSGQTIYVRLGEDCSSTSYDVAVLTGQFCRYERRDWEVPFVTFYNPGAASVTLTVLVGRPVPDLNVLPLATPNSNGYSVSGSGLLTTLGDPLSTNTARVFPPTDGTAAQSGLLVWSQNELYDGTNFRFARTPSVFKVAQTSAVANNTPTAIWTPAAGKKFRLMGFLLSISVSSVGRVQLLDGATVIWQAFMGGNAPLSPQSLGNGYLSAAANNVLNYAGQTGAATDFACVAWGTEE